MLTTEHKPSNAVIPPWYQRYKELVAEKLLTNKVEVFNITNEISNTQKLAAIMLPVKTLNNNIW